MRRGGRLLLLVGLLLAFVAAGAIFLVLQNPAADPNNQASQSPTAIPQKQVIFARIDIPANRVLTDTETFLVPGTIPETEYNGNPDDYFTSFSELSNRQSIADIPAGEPIRASQVVESGLANRIPAADPGQPTLKALPIQVNNLTGVADQIRPGDFVDFLASFSINQTIIRPGVDDQGLIIQREQDFVSQSTKTIVQNIQVLQILKPAVVPEGTPTPAPEGEQPQTGPDGTPIDGAQGTNTIASTANTLQQGNWIIVVAVTDQEAELIKFALEQGTGFSLVLRGGGDQATETTVGATLDILVTQFGLPVPVPFASDGQITNGGSSGVPQPTAAPVATPTP